MRNSGITVSFLIGLISGARTVYIIGIGNRDNVMKERSIMPNLGEFVLQLLRKQGKSLRALARETGVSNSYLSQLTRGLFVPSPEVLVRLAPHMGVTPRELFEAAGWLEPAAPSKAAPVKKKP